MGKTSKEKLEDLRANNAQLREENEHLKKQVQMFNKRMAEMEKNLETSIKLLPLLKKKFEECQDSLTIVMADWGKHIMQLIHLGEKDIQMVQPVLAHEALKSFKYSSMDETSFCKRDPLKSCILGW
jgi:predicted nuclease with TOPRIM domain